MYSANINGIDENKLSNIIKEYREKFLTFSLIILSSLTAKSQSFYNNNKFSFNDSLLIFGFQDSIIKYLPFVLKNKTFEQVQDFKIVIDTVSGNFNTFRVISKTL